MLLYLPIFVYEPVCLYVCVDVHFYVPYIHYSYLHIELCVLSHNHISHLYLSTYAYLCAHTYVCMIASVYALFISAYNYIHILSLCSRVLMLCYFAPSNTLEQG